MFLPDDAVQVAALSEHVAQSARFKLATESNWRGINVRRNQI